MVEKVIFQFRSETKFTILLMESSSSPGKPHILKLFRVSQQVNRDPQRMEAYTPDPTGSVTV